MIHLSWYQNLSQHPLPPDLPGAEYKILKNHTLSYTSPLSSLQLPVFLLNVSRSLFPLFPLLPPASFHPVPSALRSAPLPSPVLPPPLFPRQPPNIPPDIALLPAAVPPHLFFSSTSSSLFQHLPTLFIIPILPPPPYIFVNIFFHLFQLSTVPFLHRFLRFRARQEGPFLMPPAYLL